jgi:hypothetical protein
MRKLPAVLAVLVPSCAPPPQPPIRRPRPRSVPPVATRYLIRRRVRGDWVTVGVAATHAEAVALVSSPGDWHIGTDTSAGEDDGAPES